MGRSRRVSSNCVNSLRCIFFSARVELAFDIHTVLDVSSGIFFFLQRGRGGGKKELLVLWSLHGHSL